MSDSEFKDMAITGSLVVGMPEQERWFEIIEKPAYEPVTENADPSKKKEKLGMIIRLSDGRSGTYYPNRTSSRRIAEIAKSNDFAKWVGLKLFWGTITKSNVAGQMKDVLYVTETWPKVAVKA